MEPLTRRIEQAGARLVILDPLSMFHDLDENISWHMVELAGLFTRIARKCRCGILLVRYHQPSRGVAALASIARAVWMLRHVTTREAEKRRICGKEKDRWRLWQCVKVNHAPGQPSIWLQVTGEGVLVPNTSQHRCQAP